jgi:hypothetical protein
MSLPVLADPFWGRLPWLLKRRGGKHSKHRKVSRPRDCARVRFRGWIWFRDALILTTFDGGDVCTR